MNNQIFSDKGSSLIRARFRTDNVTAFESGNQTSTHENKTNN
jgi:hypothetical protein